MWHAVDWLYRVFVCFRIVCSLVDPRMSGWPRAQEALINCTNLIGQARRFCGIAFIYGEVLVLVETIAHELHGPRSIRRDAVRFVAGISGPSNHTAPIFVAGISGPSNYTAPIFVAGISGPSNHTAPIRFWRSPYRYVTSPSAIPIYHKPLRHPNISQTPPLSQYITNPSAIPIYHKPLRHPNISQTPPPSQYITNPSAIPIYHKPLRHPNISQTPPPSQYITNPSAIPIYHKPLRHPNISQTPPPSQYITNPSAIPIYHKPLRHPNISQTPPPSQYITNPSAIPIYHKPLRHPNTCISQNMIPIWIDKEYFFGMELADVITIVDFQRLSTRRESQENLEK